MRNYTSNVAFSTILLNALENNKTQKIKLILSSDIHGAYYMILNDEDVENYENLCKYIINNEMPSVDDIVYKNNLLHMKENDRNNSFKKTKYGRWKLENYCKSKLSKLKSKDEK